MIDRRYRYWHKQIEYCRRCHYYRPIVGKTCTHGHPIEGVAPTYRAVNGRLMRGALVVYKNPITAAQAANFLREWNTEESWRDIARRLWGKRPAEHISRIAASLCAHASRRAESDEVMRLLGARPQQVRTLAFRFYDDAAFDRARRFVDAGGDRTQRLLELIGDDE